MLIFAAPIAGIYAMSATGLGRGLHDHGHLQLRAGRDRHVPRVRRLGAVRSPRRAPGDRGAAHGAGDRAADRHRTRPGDHAPPAGQGAGRAAHRDGRPDVRVHRPGQHDLGPEPQPHAPAAVRRGRCPRRGRGGHVGAPVHDRGRDRVGRRVAAPVVPDPPRRVDASGRRQPRAGEPLRRVPSWSRASRGRSGARWRRWPGSCSHPTPACRRADRSRC